MDSKRPLAVKSNGQWLTKSSMANKYYGNGRVREICHGVKERDPIAIKEMADYFLNIGIITKNSVIIPAPQHTGTSVYTKQVAEIVCANTNATMLDILRCEPHETLYIQKKKGYMKAPKMFLTSNEWVEISGKMFFLDNVLATGTTFQCANKLFEDKLTPLVYATS